MIIVPIPSLQIKLFGNWQKVFTLTERIGPSISSGYQKSVKKFSTQLLRIVREAIGTGTPPKGSGVYWPPLSPNTLKKYPDEGHHIYYLTGLYYRSVGVFNYGSKTLIGLPPRTKRASQGGLTLAQLAKILEKGNDNIPARPLWAPSFKAMGGTTKLRAEIIKGIRQQLYRDFGIRANQVKW